jgi:hypothetical protein
VVVLVFFWNDLGNNYVRTFPRFRLSDGALVWPEPMVIEKRQAERPKRRGWLRYSYLYRFVSDRLKIVGYRLKLLLGIPLEAADFVEDDEREAAWQLTGALVREIRDQAASIGAKLPVVAMPDQVQWSRDGARQPLTTRYRSDCARSATAGIPLLDLVPALRHEHARAGEALYYAKDRHLRARGHEIVAVALKVELDRLAPR